MDARLSMLREKLLSAQNKRTLSNQDIAAGTNAVDRFLIDGGKREALVALRNKVAERARQKSKSRSRENILAGPDSVGACSGDAKFPHVSAKPGAESSLIPTVPNFETPL